MNDDESTDIELIQRELGTLRMEFGRLRERIQRSECLRSAHAARLGEDLRELYCALVGEESAAHSREFFIAGARLVELARELAEPLLEAPPPVAPPRAVEPAAARTVLYIEDFTPVAEVLEMILEQRPHVRLMHAENGRTGLRLAREHHPALILLDLHLPDMQGIDLLRLLREDPELAETPVIVVSGDSMPSQIDRMLQAGARNYLTKPLETRRFLCTIDDVLPA